MTNDLGWSRDLLSEDYVKVQHKNVAYFGRRRAMLFIAYAHSAYDYARLMLESSRKAMRIARGIFSRYNNLIFAVLEA